MKRRTFLVVGGVTAIAASPSLRAQQGEKAPRIGVLWHAASAAEEGKYLVAFERGFRDLGYVNGRNIVLEHRFPAEEQERFQKYADELVAMPVDVLVAVTRPAALAAQRATKSIPIVFALDPEPIQSGLVKSLARPGGNVTGLSNIALDLAQKRLELFRQVVPRATRLALLINPREPTVTRATIAETQALAAAIKMTVVPVEARARADLDRAFVSMEQQRVEGVIIAVDPIFYNERSRIATLAIAHRLPAMHVNADAVEAGVLMSYGADHEDILHRTPAHVVKILKGAKPSDLPVELPTRLTFVVNATTATAIGLKLSPDVLARADRVME